MMKIEEIKNIIKEKILVERLELEDISAEEIDDNEPLFGDGLGLDSVEALDVISGVEEEFQIKMQGLPEEEVQKTFSSVETLAVYINERLMLNV
ncbi:MULTISPECIES: phosphopantetheine-binding protein [Metabacillus]|jgi:acyl carrier protein|uniref:Phosphopantetheine-binding protein n=1 Tax=Metabacillus rhizolycopersici TaxID=2875709 RepID=A0ABS7URC5_9BACI|nr:MULTISPECIES: phosphopantetheine-binding protein [Metabacillus]MBZ5750614.1 phosphopantetheine-binding protein [Metabacillus rhizolycopersici]MCM3651753.1 phosphopantetheine-binding protein [Metabacillus litoralis]